MIINHPLLGPRDSMEFVYKGDAVLIARPDWQARDADSAFDDYMHLRDNPAGLHRELWYHEQGDRSWLVVTRNTVTHEITKVELARDVARKEAGGKKTRSATLKGAHSIVRGEATASKKVDESVVKKTETLEARSAPKKAAAAPSKAKAAPAKPKAKAAPKTKATPKPKPKAAPKTKATPKPKPKATPKASPKKIAAPKVSTASKGKGAPARGARKKLK